MTSLRVGESSIAEIQSEVIVPVLRTLFRAEEVTKQDLWFAATQGAPRDPTDDPHAFPERILWFRIEAASEEFSQIVWGNQPYDAELTFEQLADRLADVLEDWIPETSFGWGQQRLADRSAWHGE